MASVILAEETDPTVGIVTAALTIAAAGYRYGRSRFSVCIPLLAASHS
jgi:hypothetical protein